MLRIGWFSTARGQTSQKLLAEAWNAIQRGDVKAEIAYVFCSREDGEAPETDQFLAQVRSYGIPLITYSFDKHKQAAGGKGMGLAGGVFAPWRESYDQQVLERVRDKPVDVVLQVGYMLVWTPLLCHELSALNLHPAAPGGPAGTWQQVIWTLIGQQATVSGVYMHLVTPSLDQGPVVTYCRYAINGPEFAAAWQAVAGRSVAEVKAAEGESLDVFQRIRQEGVRREVPMILATLTALGEGRVQLLPTGPGDAVGNAIAPVDLSSAIEAGLAGKRGKGRSMKPLVVLGLVFAALIAYGAPNLGSAWKPAVSPAVSAVVAPVATAVGNALPAVVPTAVAVALPAEVVLTEAEVNQRVTAAIAGGHSPIPVQGLKVVLRGDNLVDLTGKVTIAGNDTDLSATLAITSANGAADVKVQRAQAGPFPLPGVLADQLAQQAMRAFGLSGVAGNQLPEGIERVEVRPGQLVMVRK